MAVGEDAFLTVATPGTQGGPDLLLLVAAVVIAFPNQGSQNSHHRTGLSSPGNLLGLRRKEKDTAFAFESQAKQCWSQGRHTAVMEPRDTETPEKWSHLWGQMCSGLH